MFQPQLIPFEHPSRYRQWTPLTVSLWSSPANIVSYSILSGTHSVMCSGLMRFTYLCMWLYWKALLCVWSSIRKLSACGCCLYKNRIIMLFIIIPCLEKVDLPTLMLTNMKDSSSCAIIMSILNISLFIQGYFIGVLVASCMDSLCFYKDNLIGMQCILLAIL